MARPRKGEEKYAPIVLSVRVPEWLYNGLQQLADDRSMTVSDVANEAMAGYLRRKGIKPAAANAR